MITGILSVVLLVVALTDPKAHPRSWATDQGMASANRLRFLGQAMLLYARDNAGAFPEDGADWRARLLKSGAIDADTLVSPDAPRGMTSFFYLPGAPPADESRRVLLLENPKIRGTGAWVCFNDGSMEFLLTPELNSLLERLTTPDGKPFHPWQDP